MTSTAVQELLAKDESPKNDYLALSGHCYDWGLMCSVFIDNFDFACMNSNWKWDDTFLKKREKQVQFTEVEQCAIHVPRAIDVRKECWFATLKILEREVLLKL